MVGEAYGGHVWLEKLTDDANVWLTAVRMEERGELAKAVLLYLEDATACLDGGTLVRAALGSTCAADCLVTMGLSGKGRRLYHVAGMLYWDNADARLGASVRESLWSLQESHEAFLLAGEEDNAKHVRQLFTSLARRANPFIGERDTFRLPTKADLAVELAGSNDAKDDTAESVELAKAIEAFILARERQRERDSATKRTVSLPADLEMETLDAQGFVGQLG
jgi:hypothetical protein